MYDFSNLLLNIWQCCFIAPVTRQSDGNGGNKKYVFSTVWYVANLVVLCGCLVIGVWAMSDDMHASKVGRSLRMKNTSSAVVTVLQVTLMSMVCAVAVVRSAGRHRTLLEIGRQLRSADAVLGPSAGQPVVIRCAFVLVTFHAVLFVVDGLLWYSRCSTSWMYTVCYVYSFVDLSSMLMFAQIAWCIGTRFQAINEVIERKLVAVGSRHQKKSNLARCGGGRSARQRSQRISGKCAATTMSITTTPIMSDNDYNTNFKNISIAKLQKFHWSFCNSIKMVNDQFGWQLFLQLFCNCVQLIVTPYFLIMDLFYPMLYGSSTTDIKFILIQVVWVLTHLSHLLLLVLPTSYATKKGERTAVIICKYLTLDVEPDDMKQLEIFVLQLHKYAIDFTACGIINLHRSTITTIIGSAITYLVILIQFKNSD